jgi:Tol biopolymer transport system component
MKKTVLSVFLFVITLYSVFSQEKIKNIPNFPLLKGKYLGQKLPGMTPKIFAPGFISFTESIETSPTISPNGDEFYFSRFSFEDGKSHIYVTKRIDNIWRKPEKSSINSNYHDKEPFISINGEKIFFCSSRPENKNDTLYDENIWFADKRSMGWTEPICLGRNINSDAREGHPTISEDHTLYFHVAVMDKSYDIYESRFENGQYLKREKLCSQINTDEYIEGEPAIAPDKSYLLFISAGRQDRVAIKESICDIYISFKNKEGDWTKAKCLNKNILSENEENWPMITSDGNYIFFSSNRNNSNYFPDIYWVDAKIIEDLKPRH